MDSGRLFSDDWYCGGRVGSQPAHDSRTAHAESIVDVDRFVQHARNASFRAIDQTPWVQEIRIANVQDRRAYPRRTY